MGKEGTKVASAVNVKDLIKDLNRAYADEWLAHYSYLYMARTCTGMMYEDMSEFLEEIAKDEAERQEIRDHVARLADYILKGCFYLIDANLQHIAVIAFFFFTHSEIM